jgi:hypothetical protein
MQQIKPIRVALKALILFAVFNVLFVAVPSMNDFVFKLLMPKLDKFPVYALYSDPSAEHGFGVQSVFDVGSLFNSHVISQGTKNPNEYRVVFIGDSTIYNGEFYSFINNQGSICGGKYLQAYNLGYHGTSATKDLIILQEAMKYSPDLIIWSVTNSITSNNARFSQANADNLLKLENVYGLSMAYYNNNQSTGKDSVFYRTNDKIRAEVRLLLYYLLLNPVTGNNGGILTIANVDAINAAPASRPVLFLWLLGKRSELDSELRTFKRITNNIPVYLINEPRPSSIVSTEPYKLYVNDLTDLSRSQGIKMMNLAELIPDQDFDTHMIHRNTDGDMLFAKAVMPAILDIACPSK